MIDIGDVKAAATRISKYIRAPLYRERINALRRQVTPICG
jgi:hypothetical protein